MSNRDIEYKYKSAEPTHNANYLIEPVIDLLARTNISDKRIFELGCGNGSITNQFSKLGYKLTAVDTSQSGIELAKHAYPNCQFEVGSAYDDLADRFGRFDCVISFEVVEHVFSPKKYAETLFDLTNSGGVAIVSTPYHGYLKNLCLALFNKFDSHFNPLWEGGHIKFWSKNTLSVLLKDSGFKEIQFINVGRTPLLAKSMIAIASKP